MDTKPRPTRVASRRVSNFSSFHTVGWSNMSTNQEHSELVGDTSSTCGDNLGEGNVTEIHDTVNQDGGSMDDHDEHVAEATGHISGVSNVGESVPTIVTQGLSSDSTVSVPKGMEAGNVSVETWQAKSQDLTKKLARARDREKALHAQLAAQSERINLELQEKQNALLEAQLSQKEQQHRVVDREQEREEILRNERARLHEETRVWEHNLALELERVKAEFLDREQELEHEINLKEVELQHQKQQQVLQHRLGDAQQKKVDNSRGEAEQSRETDGQEGRNAQIGTWLEGVREGRTMGRESSPVVTGLTGPPTCDPNDPAYNSLLQGLVHSGTQILSEVGLDQNTTQFIASQAMRAKGRTMGVNRGRSLT